MDGVGRTGTRHRIGCDRWDMRGDGPRGDADLLAAVAGGDYTALRLLYERHAPWLSVRLTRRCNDTEIVADVLQDSFVALWQGAGRWRGDGEVAAWIWGIAVRRLVSRLRGRRRAVPISAEDLSVSVDSEPSVEERVLLGIEYGDLAGVLEQLSPQLRAVVQATVLDGLTTREAAQLLGVPEATVRTRLHRAKARLRVDLAEKGGVR